MLYEEDTRSIKGNRKERKTERKKGFPRVEGKGYSVELVEFYMCRTSNLEILYNEIRNIDRVWKVTDMVCFMLCIF